MVSDYIQLNCLTGELSISRNYFPNTKAVMMDLETLNSFPAAEGKPATNQNLQRLSQDELKLYQHLRKNNIRLEQEKITQTFAVDKIYEALQINHTINHPV